MSDHADFELRERVYQIFDQGRELSLPYVDEIRRWEELGFSLVEARRIAINDAETYQRLRAVERELAEVLMAAERDGTESGSELLRRLLRDRPE